LNLFIVLGITIELIILPTIAIEI